MMLGYVTDNNDCDDDSSYTYPGSAVLDGGECLSDQDGDGYPPSTDCDDNDASINPSATEIFADGIDQNCDGVEYCYIDIDQDGYGSSDDLDGDGLIDGIPSIDLDCTDLLESSTSDDCNDLSATVNPGASEILSDGIDQNCDGVIE